MSREQDGVLYAVHLLEAGFVNLVFAVGRKFPAEHYFLIFGGCSGGYWTCAWGPRTRKEKKILFGCHSQFMVVPVGVCERRGKKGSLLKRDRFRPEGVTNVRRGSPPKLW